VHDRSIDLAAFGRPFIANPDLVQKLRTGQKLVEYDANAHLTVLV
jgi:2,4-dienoyl-CoA reductase-like NADH-dependent reductase (Old Yellow Enzyme family)